MSDPGYFKKFLGKEKYYHDFLVFFQTEMEKKGWEQTLNEYMFAGDEQADDILGSMYAGTSRHILHHAITNRNQASSTQSSISDSGSNSNNQPSSVKH